LKTAFCTISTLCHIGKTKTLLQSVAGSNTFDLFCLLTDSNSDVEPAYGEIYHNLSYLTDENSVKIKSKYNGDALRWSCKPLYIKYLLSIGYDKVIYCDNDIFFYQSPSFLFEKLDDSNILLSPHFYNSNPNNLQNWFEANYTVGLFNAGFIGVNKNALDFLDWWAECCIYNVKKSYWRGLFDDQKYLDLVPIKFEKVEILKHKGCNVAGWNMEVCKRTISEENSVLINDLFPIIFMHFTPLTFEKIKSGEDNLLKNHLAIYENALIKNNASTYKSNKWSAKNILNYLRYLNWKLFRLFE
jgi:hypothetical protein